MIQENISESQAEQEMPAPETFRSRLLSAADLLQRERCGLSPSGPLNGKTDLSGEMALRIEKNFAGKDGLADADAVVLRH